MRSNSMEQGMYRYGASISILMMLLMAMLMAAMPVRADVLVSPLRVYLDDDKRSSVVTLRNPSDGARTYRVEWLEQGMSEEGAYTVYAEGETTKHMLASPYLRLSPRQITVPAKSNQSVRIEYRPGKDMAPGEYRSSLMFRVVDELSEPYSVSKIDAGKGMTLTLNMQLSISIPVVLRHQVSEVPEVKIDTIDTIVPAKQGDPLAFSVVLQRSGMVGSFGNLYVDMQRSPESPVERIGMAENISIFADLSRRRLLINLRDPSIPAGAWIRISYQGADEYSGVLWDEKVFQVK